MAEVEQALYVQFSENNAWEGEAWHRYIPIAGNEKAIERLRQIVDSQDGGAEDDDPGGAFGIREDILTEEQVDTLVKYANEDTSYSAAHGKLSGTLSLDGGLNFPAVTTAEDLRKLEIERRMRPSAGSSLSGE